MFSPGKANELQNLILFLKNLEKTHDERAAQNRPGD